MEIVLGTRPLPHRDDGVALEALRARRLGRRQFSGSDAIGTGGLTINTSSTSGFGSASVRLLANEQINNGATVTLFSNGTGNIAQLNLNGFTETVNGLSSTGTLTKAVVTSNLAGTGTLIVGDNNANASYGGIIQNGTTPATMLVAVNKIGTGTQTFSGTNTYTGDTNINAGTLLVTGATAGGNMIVNTGGTLGGNGDGATTSQDFFQFLAAFFAGC